jgi:hypothetical protein
MGVTGTCREVSRVWAMKSLFETTLFKEENFNSKDILLHSLTPINARFTHVESPWTVTLMTKGQEVSSG